MKTKMSLDAFKMQAEKEKVELALENVQGGKLNDCHGFSGKVGKAGKAIGEWAVDNISWSSKDGWKIGGN